jgi:hypothetical protein
VHGVFIPTTQLRASSDLFTDFRKPGFVLAWFWSTRCFEERHGGGIGWIGRIERLEKRSEEQGTLVLRFSEHMIFRRHRL